eukprot:2339408-Heterocapsa_arctica.AAC.1
MKDYSAQIAQARLIDEARQQALVNMALSQDGTNAAFGVDKMTPCLLNMSTCADLAGCLLYYVPLGAQRT